MRNSRISTWNLICGLLITILLLAATSLAAQEPGAESTPSLPAARLPLDQVVSNLEERNAQRTAALEQFEGDRIYRLAYRGFPSDHDAAMTVKVSFHAPSSKEFSVVSQTGSRFIIDHIFKRLLEGEVEAAKGDNRRQTALTRENYDFAMAGFENTSDGGQYVITLLPKTKNKFLYRGKIWVDANDFAVARIEGEPGKNPSFMIKKTEIAHKYIKVDNFWLPAENHTQSLIRLGGTATLTIQYQNYKILKASALNTAANTH
ncbi:MAG: hypothetical protein ACLQLC_21290 [Candidatus Sulfotelmatobacter sp.]